MDLSGINFLAVAVAGLVSFGLGALWYSPLLFGRRWQKELGYTDEYLKKANMVQIFGTSFVMMLVMALGLAWLMKYSPEISPVSGLVFGLTVGMLFSATSIAINYLYQRKSLVLWLIDTAYQVLFMGISGAIIGAWQ